MALPISLPLVFNDVTKLIGKTPMITLSKTQQKNECYGTMVAKLDYFQPGCSTKDRAALSMIIEAEKEGILTFGSTILEPTSGNTGVALALIGARRGYHVITVLPKGRSREKKILMAALGAEVLIVDGGYRETCEKAYKLQKTLTKAVILDQNSNPANPLAHYCTTGPEIWQDTSAKVDIFVCGCGTGGTITGTGRFLKEKNPNIKIIAVEPFESSILSGGNEGCHGIQGIGPGFIPSCLDQGILDEIIKIPTTVAYKTTLELIKEEGILVGMSSGAALAATIQVAKRPENKNKLIVTLFPSGAERYLSSPMFAPLAQQCEDLPIL